MRLTMGFWEDGTGKLEARFRLLISEHIFQGKDGGGGGGNNSFDRETMFSQLAKQTDRQRFYERAGKFSAVISPVSAARVQC